MTHLMHRTVVLLGLLIVAIVLSLAAEGACGECAHGCCVRFDGTRRFASTIRRVLLWLAGVLEAVARPLRSLLLRFHGARPHRACHGMAAAPLRI